MKTYIQSHQEYQSREVDLIEQFNSSYQPYLYTYIRYSKILILFLKKHKTSFIKLISDYSVKQKGYLKIFPLMVNSLKNLHFQQIIHRDLKPDNNIMFDFQNQINNIDDLLQTEITCVIIDYDRSKSLGYLGEQIKTRYVCNTMFKPPIGSKIFIFI
ncbi:unnamed protein product [Paramecium sonneborni]|uniref:Protein kinase domain-containing protein n=1 Tax=Paramecium sonneborni TaxID=65129 RepID=A0A8S1QY93_9CILI|nr:unnamed protein product [Paramecium sonneborni]